MTPALCQVDNRLGKEGGREGGREYLQGEWFALLTLDEEDWSPVVPTHGSNLVEAEVVREVASRGGGGGGK